MKIMYVAFHIIIFHVLVWKLFSFIDVIISYPLLKWINNTREYLPCLWCHLLGSPILELNGLFIYLFWWCHMSWSIYLCYHGASIFSCWPHPFQNLILDHNGDSLCFMMSFLLRSKTPQPNSSWNFGHPSLTSSYLGFGLLNKRLPVYILLMSHVWITFGPLFSHCRAFLYYLMTSHSPKIDLLNKTSLAHISLMLYYFT